MGIQHKIDDAWTWVEWIGVMATKAILWIAFAACVPLVPVMAWRVVLGL